MAIIKQLTTLVVKNRPPLISTSLPLMIQSGIRLHQSDYQIEPVITIEEPPTETIIATNVEWLEDAIAKLLINA